MRIKSENKFQEEFEMKKLIALFAVTVMLFALAIPTAALVFENDVIDAETGEVTMGGGIVIDNPYAKLYVDFFPNGAYPDDFAGVWVENGGGFYVFGLVEGTDSSKYEAVLGEYAGQYRFEYRKYSYNFLKSIKNDISDALREELEVYGWGIYEDKNVIFYDTASADAEAYAALERAIQKVAAARGIAIENDVAELEESGPYVEADAVDIAFTVEDSPKTGVVIAVIPAATALAALTACRKKKNNF